MLGLLCSGFSTFLLGHWDVFPIGFGFLGVLSEPFLLLGGEHLVYASKILSRGKVSVCAVPVLRLNAINLGGSGYNIDSFCSQGLLHHHGKVRGTSLEVHSVRA